MSHDRSRHLSDDANPLPKREPVHFGFLMRTLMKNLPTDVEEFVCPTILALHAHCDNFMLKEDLEAGRIGFAGKITYDQLAGFCKISRQAAKWRVKECRDRWNLLVWKRGKLGIYFRISYERGNGLADSKRDVSAAYVPDKDGNSAGSVRELHGNSAGQPRLPESANRLAQDSPRGLTDSSRGLTDYSERANQLAPLSLLSKATVQNTSVEGEEKKLSSASQSSKAKSKPTQAVPIVQGLDASRPKALTGSPSPAVPPRLCDSCGRAPASPFSFAGDDCLACDRENRGDLGL